MLRTEYGAYLASAEWAAKRQARLALDGNRCRLCDEDGTQFHLEVHHRPSSYRLIPDESVQDDLTSVCSRCHDLITTTIRSDHYRKRTLPTIEVITEHVSLRLEIDYGMARNSLQISVLGPADTTQRQDSQPPRQMGQGDQTDFIEAHQNRR